MNMESDIDQLGEGQIRGLFISAGHNYFGHHGQPASEHPIVRVSQIECVAGRGIKGDRFFDFKADYKGQITFFDWATFNALCAQLGVINGDPARLRRNVLCQGLDLPRFVGRIFAIQGIQFEGVEECRPCYWMNQAVHPGAEQWLQGRGGLRAKILTNGVLKICPPS